MVDDDLTIPDFCRLSPEVRAAAWERNPPQPMPTFTSTRPRIQDPLPAEDKVAPPPPPPRKPPPPRPDAAIFALPAWQRRWNQVKGRWEIDPLAHLWAPKGAGKAKAPVAAKAVEPAAPVPVHPKLKGAHLAIFNELQTPKTKAQVAEALGMLEHSVGARMAELRKSGYSYLQEKNAQGKYTFQIIEGPPLEGEQHHDASTGKTLDSRNNKSKRGAGTGVAA